MPSTGASPGLQDLPAVASSSANRRGIIAMTTAMVMLSSGDALMKLASTSVPPGHSIAIRGLLASTLAFCLVWASGHLRSLSRALDLMVLMRSGIEAVTVFLFITSLARLPLANVTTIMMATPIILALIALVIGLERIGWRGFATIGLGFVGVLVVVRPDPTAFDLYSGLVLLAAALVAVRDIATRRIEPGIPSVVVTFATTCTVCLVGALFALGEPSPPAAWREILMLLAAAGFVTLGNLAVITALRDTDVSVVGPFRYTIVIFAILLGFLVFDEWPDGAAWLGAALIVASGLKTLRRDRMRPADGSAVGESLVAAPMRNRP
jgi:drug/metabolite transporter (DMT)-like permease